MASLIRVLLAGLISIPLCAQTEIGSASLNGTVTDPSSAVVAGAKVSVRDSATGLERTTGTSGAGVYLFLGQLFCIRVCRFVGRVKLTSQGGNRSHLSFFGMSLSL